MNQQIPQNLRTKLIVNGSSDSITESDSHSTKIRTTMAMAERVHHNSLRFYLYIPRLVPQIFKLSKHSSQKQSSQQNNGGPKQSTI
jgi:hypothetical protein